MRTYRGSCHCGAVTFTITTGEITKGIRCNCSICRRRGAVMSDVYFTPDEIVVEGKDSLALYQWGDRVMNHWFCRTCGINPFAEVVEGATGPASPVRYRVNLGCVEGIDPFALEIRLLDGASL